MCDSCLHSLEEKDGRAQRGAEAGGPVHAVDESHAKENKKVRPSPLVLEQPESQWKASADDSQAKSPQSEGERAMLAAGMGAPFPGESL